MIDLGILQTLPECAYQMPLTVSLNVLIFYPTMPSDAFVKSLT